MGLMVIRVVLPILEEEVVVRAAQQTAAIQTMRTQALVALLAVAQGVQAKQPQPMAATVQSRAEPAEEGIWPQTMLTTTVEPVRAVRSKLRTRFLQYQRSISMTLMTQTL